MRGYQCMAKKYKVGLKTEFLVKPEYCPIFLLYDRDYKSYKHNESRGKYVRRYTDPYSNEEGYQGQLLLSYPAVESYILSCIQENVFEQRYLLGTEAKVQLAQCGFSEEEISEDGYIIHATILELGVIVEYEDGEDELEINS